jgi:membrane fusion protein, multidrug efflux system
MKKTIKIIVIVLILAIIAAAVALYMHHRAQYPSTDDAYVQAHVVNIAPRVSGRVSKTLIHNNMAVKKGQLLFEIDATPFKITEKKAQSTLNNTLQIVAALQSDVKSAKATLKENQAQLINATQNYKRIIKLVKKGSASKQQGDDVTSKLHVAQAAVTAANAGIEAAQEKLGEPGEKNAQVQIAQAQLAQARLNLSYTKIKAPANGTVSNYSMRAGDELAAGQSYFALIESGDWWATANYKETDLSRIRVGQSANISVDMYPNHTFTGKVISLSRGSGTTFSLLPPENATGNWVKVTQRFPIRIAFTGTDTAHPLRMGASCTVTVNTTNTP